MSQQEDRFEKNYSALEGKFGEASQEDVRKQSFYVAAANALTSAEQKNYTNLEPMEEAALNVMKAAPSTMEKERYNFEITARHQLSKTEASADVNIHVEKSPENNVLDQALEAVSGIDLDDFKSITSDSAAIPSKSTERYR